MAGREIPGYYFDAAKNKYFKIAREPTALYSETVVRKRKADEAAANDASRVAEANRRRVRRSRLGGVAEREIGRGSGRVEELRKYVAGWEEQKAAVTLWSSKRPCVFDVDMDLNLVFYSMDTKLMSGPSHAELGTTGPDLDHSSFFGNSEVHSISISADRSSVLATWDTWDRGINAVVGNIENWGLDINIASRIQSPKRPYEDTTLRCACAAPLGAPYMFAIGTDHHSLLLVDKQMNRVPSPITSSSPTLALTFLSESPNIVLTGKRSGHIPIADLRVPEGGNAGIRHATSVARIKQVAEHSMVVGGLQDQMCVYDLRFLRGTRKSEPTRPVARMWGHRNETRHDVDVVVDRSMGLVAAAQVEGGGGVRIFDAQSGTEVGYVGGGQPEGEYVRQVMFVEGKRGMGLWASRGLGIVEYTWALRDRL